MLRVPKICIWGASITNFCTDGGRLAGLSDESYARSRDRSRCVDVKWSTGGGGVGAETKRGSHDLKHAPRDPRGKRQRLISSHQPRFITMAGQHFHRYTSRGNRCILSALVQQELH